MGRAGIAKPAAKKHWVPSERSLRTLLAWLDQGVDSGGESWVVFSKVQPYLEGVREMMGNENYLRHLDALLMGRPNAAETLAARREQMKRWMQARSDMTKSA